MKHEFMMKRLGNMIGNDGYFLPIRFASPMQDMGYIDIVRKIFTCFGSSMTASHYEVTDLGKKSYQKWLDEK